MTRQLPPGLHPYGSLQIGDWFDTDIAHITRQMILNFADLTGDHFQIHLSDSGAQAHGLPAQVAHGLLILSLVEGLKSRSLIQMNSFAALGWEWQFVTPVLAGDTIRCRITLLEKRKAGPRAGLLRLDVQVFNQRGQMVQQGQTRIMARRV